MRSPEKYSDTFAALSTKPDSLKVVAGDVTAPATLPEVVRDCDGGVIFAASGATFFSAKSVDFQGVANVAQAVRETGSKVGRVVLVSSCLTTPKNRFHPIRIILNNIRWGLMDNKFKGEEALRQSGVAYTIVRPGGLSDGPKGEKKLLVAQGDTRSGMVARADVAAVCVAALGSPATERVTFELVTEPGDAPPLAEQLKGLFAGLKKDE